jgi:hypothetical protein
MMLGAFPSAQSLLILAAWGGGGRLVVGALL